MHRQFKQANFRSNWGKNSFANQRSARGDGSLENDDQPGPSGINRKNSTTEKSNSQTKVLSERKSIGINQFNNDKPGPSWRKDDDQPGPSGINTNKVSLNAQTKKASNPKEEIEKDPFKLFAHSVSIPSLEEAYNSNIKAEQYLFRFALILAIGAIIYESVAIVSWYQSQTTVFVDMAPAATRAPFPNITICMPMLLGISKPKFAQLSNSTRAQQLMSKFHLNMDDALDFVMRMLYVDINAAEATTPIYLLTKVLHQRFRESALKLNRNQYLEFLELPCPETLSNCEFNGWQFDCCEIAQFLTSWQQSCFVIKNDFSKVNNGTDPISLEKAGMSVTTSIDWNRGYFQDGSASDGFYILINQIPSGFNVPIPIPAGMDAVIALAPGTMVNEITSCQSIDQLPKLEYFDYYDFEGFNCKWEKLTNMIDQSIGCKLPGASFFPINDTCSFEQKFIAAMVLGDTDMEKMKLSSGTTQLKDRMTNMFLALKLVGENSPCKPLCSRWTYPVLSASYGLIQYADHQAEQARQFANRSWSRIRIIMPQSAFVHIEKPRASPYLIMCDIGGMMGVYIGFSMITLAEIFGYGGNIIWVKLRKKRTAAKVHPEVIPPKVNLAETKV